MEQRRLYKTLEKLASQRFDSEKTLLEEVIKLVIEYENISVIGGRVWQLDKENASYKLLFQTGNVSIIEDSFQLKISENEVFDNITEERTILANETNQVLLEKGIFKYSASGVGNKIEVDGKKYYEYLLALNSDTIDKELRYTLNIVATFLTSFLKEREIRKVKKDLIKDLDDAKKLQRSILPEHEYTFHHYDIFGITIPAKTLGGDFFDYVKIGDDEERLGIVVGDAASKGLSAAAEAMYISGAVRMASTFQIKISPLMYRINNLINKIFSDDRFTTLFYGEISNDTKGLFLYANGGHNPPIFLKKEENSITMLDTTGPLLGPAPNSKYETDSINFSKGDILVVYSDGITDAANHKYEFYDEDRLIEAIKKNHDLTPKELTYKILDDVMTFSTEDSQYQDDKTLVVIKRKG